MVKLPAQDTCTISTWNEIGYQEEKAKIQSLLTSLSREDRITGILMDDALAGFGFWEKFAREKAQLILDALYELDRSEEGVNHN